MANINIKLLLNKSAQVKAEGLDVSLTLNMAQYSVIAGENNATIIEVDYPDNYKSGTRYADMKNAKGEGGRIHFSGVTNVVSFPLPASMTWVGTTTLVFYSEIDGTKVLWTPVKIPIKATGIDYKEIALANPDLLSQAISDSANALNISNSAETKAQSVVDRADSGEFKGNTGADGIQGVQGESGANQTVMWGVNAPSPFSNLKWRII